MTSDRVSIVKMVQQGRLSEDYLLPEERNSGIEEKILDRLLETIAQYDPATEQETLQ